MEIILLLHLKKLICLINYSCSRYVNKKGYEYAKNDRQN